MSPVKRVSVGHEGGSVPPKKIAVVYGGWSSEAEISRKSGKAVASALRKLGYEVVELELTRDIAVKLLELKPDLVFPVLHGHPGEDGTFQGLLEILGIPYVGEGVKTSAVCMDKDYTKRLLKSASIPTPPWITLKRGETLPVEKINSFPVVVKPALEGSSIGLHIVEDIDSLREVVDNLLTKVEKILLEKYIPGREFTVGFVKGEFFEPLEIIPKGGIYDYETKYTAGMADFEPVRDSKLKEKLIKISQQVVDLLEISTISRIDFRLDRTNEELYVLEVNTIPGMTETSLLPKMASLSGYSFGQLMEKLLK